MKGNKYRTKPTTCAQGHKHPSRREAKRCDELHLMQKAGHISDLEIEPQFWFVINHRQLKHANGRRAGYCADFAYVENGKQIIEEVKGWRVRDFALREALFRHLFPTYELRIVK